MMQYRVEIRTVHGTSKLIDVMANDQAQAKYMAEHQSGMVVLSTQLIG